MIQWAAIRAFFGRVGWQVWALLAAVMVGVYLDRKGEARGRREEKSKQKVELAKETARQERALREASDDLHTSREAADDARERAPVGRTVDELRQQDPGLADIVFGPRDGSSGARES